MKNLLTGILAALVISAMGQETKPTAIEVPSNFNQITPIENGETETIKCKIISVSGSHLIVMVDDPDYHHRRTYSPATGDYVDESDNYKKLVIEDYPSIESAAVDQSLTLRAKRVGTIVKSRYGRPVVLELWSCAAAQTAALDTQKKSDEIARKLEIEAMKKNEANRAAAKAKVEEGKTRALKSNQEAAAKGDSFGLMRMGERYRDGEGVEKDLSKARDYFEKSFAADTNNFIAKEELSKLPSQ